MPRCMYAGSANVRVRLVARVRVQVVDDRLVDVPADEIDRRERRERAAGVRADELIHVRDAVLFGELRDLVEHLEADAVAGERRRVGALDHDAAERRLEHLAHRLDDRADRCSACGMSSQPRMTVGGLNRWMPRKCVRKSSLRPAHIAAIDRPEDTVATIEPGARTLVDRARTPAAWSRGPRRRLEDQVGVGDDAREVGVVRADRDRFRRDLALRELLGARAAGFGLLERAREERGRDAGGGEYGSRRPTPSRRWHRARRSSGWASWRTMRQQIGVPREDVESRSLAKW